MPRFVPRQRKHKVLARSKSKQHESQISSKKAKRLEKYLEAKLKKDENVALVRKLEKGKVDTTYFQSSKHLGKRTFNDYVEDGPARPRSFQSTRGPTEYASDVDSEDSFEQDNGDAFGDSNEHISTESATTSAGAGLKAPLAIGADGMPVIQTRQKPKKTRLEVPAAELPWDGFDSESSDEDDQTSDSEEGGVSGASDSHSDNDGPTESADQSEDDSGREDSKDSDTSSGTSAKPRNSAFKAWAQGQVNKSLGHMPSYEQALDASATLPPVASFSNTPRPVEPHPFADPRQTGMDDSQLDPRSNRKAFSVPIVRPEDVQESRLNLPIVAEEQRIMEAIYNHPVVLLSGDTGCGKTTQVPQFLFEAGYGNPESSTPGMIGITQPRRVAAVSMSDRVKYELGEHGSKVAHQVRFETSYSSHTAIKYMTDGILLRELSQDVMLSKYSAIIIDEAHERTTNTDVLIGMLSRVVPLRLKLSKDDPSIKPLKLVIMSATFRTSDFLQNPRLFKPDPLPPPLVQVGGRQFPVTVHYARQTQRDYLEEVCRKVIKGHRKLPLGGMLVFLTGQNEILSVRRNLMEALPSTESTFSVPSTHVASYETPREVEDLEFGRTDTHDDFDEIEFITGSEEDDNATEWENNDHAFDLGETPSGVSNIHVLPLYSQLPSTEQRRVFQAPPPGSRLIILATNVAETSLTIPGIRYVFDAGRCKERVFDQTTGVQSFPTNWISKASAKQRAGRAGRTGPGHCYRLYSSAVYERDFLDHAKPEITRTPIENVVLQLKSFQVPNVLKFPFPTVPPRSSLARAEALLKNLGALAVDGRITSIGTNLSTYPVSPRLSKMLNVCVSSHPELIGHAVAIAAALSVGELFVPENPMKSTDEDATPEDVQRSKGQNRARAFLSKTDPKSDVIKVLTAVLKYGKADNKEAFCETTFTRSKAMQEVAKLRSQLWSIVRTHNPSLLSPRGSPLASEECTILNEMVASGYVDQVAVRADLAPNPQEMPRKPRRAIDVPYLPLMPLQSHPQTLTDRAVFLHPSSVLARLSPNELPTYIAYSHLQQSQPELIGPDRIARKKTRMFPLAPIQGEQLARLAHDTPLLEYSKPIGHKITMLGGFPQRRECWLIPSMVGAAGAIGWPLPARKVVQRRDVKDNSGWAIENFLL
jgi:ATP-dependent RNA helicase DHX37/DHR1